MGFFHFNKRGQSQVDLSVAFPVGITLPCGLSQDDVPSGWLLCDGSAVLPTEYPQLHAFLTSLGSPFGSLSGNPRLPDTRTRMVVGRGTHSQVDAVGKNDGLSIGARSMSHVHSVPGHTHTILSHNHPYGAHQHTSPSHTHVGELHQHDLPSHSHPIVNTTGSTANGAITVNFGDGTERIAHSTHNHGAGSLSSAAVDPDLTNPAGNAPTSAPTNQANGGLTGPSTATTTGNATDSLDPNPTANSSADAVPFGTARFIMKAVA